MSKYPSLTDGAKYRDVESDKTLTVLDAPETAGRPTHELDCATVDVEWEDGSLGSIYLDHFGYPNPRFERVDS